ncbi:hypothetical protein ACO1O0_002795 [Amphichorda felina]
MLRVLVFLLAAAVPVLSGFFTNPARYRRELWQIGEIETIEYETDYEEYTIALWQQSLSQDAANMGPIIFQTSKKGSEKFDWTVQVYDLELEDSNVFFLWMFKGDAKMQGNQSAPQVSSSFFNITSKPEPSSTTLAEPEPTTSVSTLESSGPTETATTVSHTSAAPPKSTTSVVPDTQDKTASTSPDLTVGAKAGIGVGVGVGGLACIACVSLLWRYLRKKTQRQSVPGLGWKQPPHYMYPGHQYTQAIEVPVRYPAELG